jgi:hypothetical protein
MEDDNKLPTEQHGNSRLPERLKPYQYKKGQSGNPSGRPKGMSLKEWAKNKLASMTEDEREDFFEGLNKDTIWEMAEGKAQANTDITSAGEKLNPILVKFIDGTNNQHTS